jgi:hypothetical protein
MDLSCGHDFSQIQIHAADRGIKAARGLGALPVTTGSDFVFGERQYQPESGNGLCTLSHGLPHVTHQEKTTERQADVVVPFRAALWSSPQVTQVGSSYARAVVFRLASTSVEASMQRAMTAHFLRDFSRLRVHADTREADLAACQHARGYAAMRDVISGPGAPLSHDVRKDMEDRLGHDFYDVRVHSDDAADASARSLNANAYTVGSHIVFQRAAFDPSSHDGRKILAHELIHVVQQRNGPVDGIPTVGGVSVSDPADRLEREAAATAERAIVAPVLQTDPVPGVRNGAVPHVVVQRQHGPAASPPQPSVLPDPTTPAATPFEAIHQRMVDNDLVAPIVYPYREQMLRRFVAWHRDLELSTLPPDAQAQGIQYALDSVRAERDRVAALPTQTAADRRERASLEVMLTRAERGTAQALAVAHAWTHEHGGDELSGAALEAEVRRLGTALSLPDWEISTIIDYGGMRYGRAEAGFPTAHGSYFAPQRLLWAIETVRSGRTVPLNTANQILGLSESEALGRLEAMHAAGDIPPQPWRLITYRTDLRKDTADPQWNDINARDPAPTTDDDRQSAEEWRRVMNLWTRDTAILGVHGGASAVIGATGWRTEMYRRRGVVALGIVCNELAEAIANQRGINLAGGITQNAQGFANDSGPRGMGTAATGRYFGRVNDEHLVPGANLFFAHENWQRQGHPWDNVIAVAGVRYPQRLDPGDTSTSTNASLPTTTGADRWVYVAEPGHPIMRTRRPAPPAQGPEERQYMTWKHQATVAEVRGNSVLALETTGTPARGGFGAGINERSKASLTNDAGTFLGVDAAAAHASPAPAVPTPPTATGPSSAEDLNNAVDAGRSAR